MLLAAMFSLSENNEDIYQRIYMPNNVLTREMRLFQIRLGKIHHDEHKTSQIMFIRSIELLLFRIE